MCETCENVKQTCIKRDADEASRARPSRVEPNTPGPAAPNRADLAGILHPNARSPGFGRTKRKTKRNEENKERNERASVPSRLSHFVAPLYVAPSPTPSNATSQRRVPCGDRPHNFSTVIIFDGPPISPSHHFRRSIQTFLFKEPVLIQVFRVRALLSWAAGESSDVAAVAALRPSVSRSSTLTVMAGPHTFPTKYFS